MRRKPPKVPFEDDFRRAANAVLKAAGIDSLTEEDLALLREREYLIKTGRLTPLKLNDDGRLVRNPRRF